MAAQEAEIAVDSTHETDSAFGDDTQSETTSLISSVTNYYFENGRRYHAYHAGAYWHHLYLLMLEGKLYLAPIPKNPQRVLDVATGTGIWAMEFADLHPSASVIGTDLSPIQPTYVPPNLQFEVDDCCDEWVYKKDSFDFIHIRGLYGSVADWGAFYKQVLRHLKPGGYIEQVEQSVVPKSEDGTTNGTIFERWGKVSLQAGDAFGKTLRIVDESRQRMIDAGFQDVTERRFKVPVGSWPKDPKQKEIGRFNRLQWEEGMEGWTMMLLTRVLGWTADEVHVYLAEMKAGLRDPTIHAYQDMSVVWARKPLTPTKND